MRGRKKMTGFRLRREREIARRAGRVIADRIPAHLRRQQALLMIEPIYEVLSITEQKCPACGGTGWQDEEALIECAVCHGFGEVPKGLADFVRGRFKGKAGYSGRRREVKTYRLDPHAQAAVDDD